MQRGRVLARDRGREGDRLGEEAVVGLLVVIRAAARGLLVLHGLGARLEQLVVDALGGRAQVRAERGAEQLGRRGDAGVAREDALDEARPRRARAVVPLISTGGGS